MHTAFDCRAVLEFVTVGKDLTAFLSGSVNGGGWLSFLSVTAFMNLSRIGDISYKLCLVLP